MIQGFYIRSMDSSCPQLPEQIGWIPAPDQVLSHQLKVSEHPSSVSILIGEIKLFSTRYRLLERIIIDLYSDSVYYFLSLSLIIS